MGLRGVMSFLFLAGMALIFTMNGSLARGELTAINVIQGEGLASPLIGENVSVEAIVVGDFQGKDKLNGFYLQEEDSDADNLPETSEGIFVYDPGELGKTENISAGDTVQVTGVVEETSCLTQIKLSEITKLNETASSHQVTILPVTLPVADTKYLERFEGMLVELPQEFVITSNDHFALNGEKTLSPSSRLPNPTSLSEPGLPAITLHALNQRSKIILDDGSKKKYPDPGPFPRTLRSGDSVQGITGILSFGFGEYRVYPLSIQNISVSNPRPDKPEPAGGTVKIASFNVENYFNGDGQGGGFQTSRGAESQAEFERQRAKIFDAITDMDADVIGLMEIENDGYGEFSAIQDLVNGLNACEGKPDNVTYSFIDPGLQKLGLDAISVGIIYNSQKVRPVGTAATISTGAFSSRNRQPLAQTFEEIATGERFTLVINHLKSKNPPGRGHVIDSDDKDKGDGQGYFNGVRTEAANDLVTWLASDPTQSGDNDYLVMGDMNSYALEDPITAMKNAGYTNLVAAFVGPDAYTYAFDDQWGTLDYALSNTNMTQQVTGATVWHINSDESPAFGYGGKWNSTDKYRSSDHDPVIVGFNLSSNAG
ncbi:ExeM/NucH family extracellular endonuclease [Methanosarcina sp. T3]|uniref:ExeM/NucH family extracellular endonuclease n=1 Tax=Methanosarcina sp. T3 TaxID=3439062 RepID=UPI003F844969